MRPRRAALAAAFVSLVTLVGTVSAQALPAQAQPAHAAPAHSTPAHSTPAHATPAGSAHRSDRPLAANLLADPGFELQPGGAPNGAWHCIGNCGVDAEAGSAHGGANNGFVRNGSGWNALFQTVPVAANTTYHLTGWIRTSGNNNDAYFGARVAGGGPVRDENHFGSLANWTALNVTVGSGAATSLDIYAGLWATADMWLQVDDLELTAVGSSQLGAGTQLYPRMIRLAHSGSANGQLIASTTTFDPQGYGAIFRSTDDGASFQQIGAVRDPASAAGQCCSSLYELPSQIGSMPAGTLVFSASYGADAGANRRMSLDLWASTDHGATWAKKSTVLTAPNAGGLWEPEMHVNAEGELTLYYSDETQQPAHSQTLMEVFSPDGVTWSHPFPVVSLANSGARPGMAVVRALRNGTWIMTYEICGSTYACDVYYRTSADGADWGDPALAGSRIVATDGTHFRHTPTTTVLDDGSATGKIVLAGQLYVNSGGGTDGGNGITLLTNTGGGAGAWTRIIAPVSVPNAYDNYCPNYSPALAPTADQRHVVEISTMYVGTTCEAFFGTGLA
ncbi:MAG: sialidase family protein [Actinocatenispora sp.]